MILVDTDPPVALFAPVHAGSLSWLRAAWREERIPPLASRRAAFQAHHRCTVEHRIRQTTDAAIAFAPFDRAELELPPCGSMHRPHSQCINIYNR